MRLNPKERKLLERLDEGFVEEKSGLPAGVGEQTIENCLRCGWIEHATCETYGTVGYQITELGKKALDDDYSRSRSVK
jgi:hypothetical protein